MDFADVYAGGGDTTDSRKLLQSFHVVSTNVCIIYMGFNGADDEVIGVYGSGTDTKDFWWEVRILQGNRDVIAPANRGCAGGGRTSPTGWVPVKESYQGGILH